MLILFHVTLVSLYTNLEFKTFFHDQSLLPTRISKSPCELSFIWTLASLKLYVLFYMDLGPELQSTARTLAFLKLLTMFNTSFIYYVPDKFLRGSWLKNFLLCT